MDGINKNFNGSRGRYDLLLKRMLFLGNSEKVIKICKKHIKKDGNDIFGIHFL